MKENRNREETRGQIIRTTLATGRTDFVLSGIESHWKVLSRGVTNMIFLKTVTDSHTGRRLQKTGLTLQVRDDGGMG